MRTILDIGEKGAESMDVAAPTPSVAISGVERFVKIIDRFPTVHIESDIQDGSKKRIEVHTLMLNDPRVFALVREMALYEPIVYAKRGDITQMGILSPNFDEHGKNRLPTIKVLPLKNPYPLISRGTDLIPDARMATMLAGSAHAEGKGVGGHDVPPEKDFEHKITIIGAVSLGKNTINEGGAHVQHAVRKRSSVATGLSDGSLGNIFIPDGADTAGFSGYGAPLVFDETTIGPKDAIFIPRGFLHDERAYGVHYPDAGRITYGASLGIMYQRLGQSSVSGAIKQIARTA